MPVLPLINLMILLGWTGLMLGAILKAIYVTTAYRPTILTLAPIHFLMLAGIFLLFALTLAARTWVQLHEPQVMAARRAASTVDAYENVRAQGRPGAAVGATDDEPVPQPVRQGARS